MKSKAPLAAVIRFLSGSSMTYLKPAGSGIKQSAKVYRNPKTICKNRKQAKQMNELHVKWYLNKFGTIPSFDPKVVYGK